LGQTNLDITTGIPALTQKAFICFEIFFWVLIHCQIHEVKGKVLSIFLNRLYGSVCNETAEDLLGSAHGLLQTTAMLW
jgi:hypothetical protein